MWAQVSKWTLLLCVASILLNIFLYLATGNRDDLVNLLGAVILGGLALLGLIFTRKKE